MNRHGRIAKLDLATRAQAVSLRRHGWTALDICARLGLEKQSELNAVSELCAREKSLRRYQFGMEVGAPAQEGRSTARRKMPWFPSGLPNWLVNNVNSVFEDDIKKVSNNLHDELSLLIDEVRTEFGDRVAIRVYVSLINEGKQILKNMRGDRPA